MRAVQEAARQLGLDRVGFYVRTNAAAPGVTPHMHWHIISPIPQEQLMAKTSRGHQRRNVGGG